jgi:Ubiquitin-Binding Zinc Finger
MEKKSILLVIVRVLLESLNYLHKVLFFPVWFQPESSCKMEEPGDSNGAKDTCEASSGNPNGEIQWICDYICSECGIEVPSGFDEERREHADYHLAQFLQQEEKAHVEQKYVTSISF